MAAEKTEAQKRAQRKYMGSVATIQIRMSPDRRDEVKALAESRGESVNALLNRLIDEALK